MEWKIKELENAVRNSCGDSYASKIHEPLQTFAMKSFIADYHADESKSIIEDMLSTTNEINKEDSASAAMLTAILLAASPVSEGNHIRMATFKAEAHIIASAQALHSLCDILAIIIYWAFRLDSIPNPIPEKRINLHSVKKVLSRHSEYSSTHNLIDETISSSEFKYLTAYTNTTKHKNLIPSNLSVSFKADKKNGIRIKKFSYDSHRGKIMNFDPKWSHDFLFIDSQTLRVNLIKVGNSLNELF